MRYLAACLRALRPFGALWMLLFAVAVTLVFGLGGGTPNSPAWLIVKFVVLGVVLTSVLVALSAWIAERFSSRRT